MRHKQDDSNGPDTLIDFTALLDGDINSSTLDLGGHGIIDHQAGQTTGVYLIWKSPVEFSPYLLGPMLITGYPNASQSIDGAQNIFKGRSYGYRRQIKFNSGHRLYLRAECDLCNRVLKSRFSITGAVPRVAISPLEPLVESWRPAGPGRIRGEFGAAWRKVDGDYLTADVLTDYEVDTNEQQENVLHRFVRMRTTVNGNEVRKSQKVMLFRELPPSVALA
jgi:Green fluorescent protein